MVDSQQRLLYKVRRSLTDGLSDEECLSLDLELRSQRPPLQSLPVVQTVDVPQPPTPNSPVNPSPPTSHAKRQSISEGTNKNALKRSAQDDLREANMASKIHVSDGYYLTHTTSPSTSNNIIPENEPPISGPSNHHPNPDMNASQPSTSQDQSLAYSYQNTVFYANSSSANTPSATDTLPQYLLSPQSPPAPIPYHPHPPLKRWPNDYTVSELSHGFHSMDLLIAQSPPGANMTQRTAFERVFGSRYVKSTVCRHRAVWRKANPQLRAQFEAMGSDDKACWGEFVRRVEGRPPGTKHSNHEIMTPSPNSGMGFHDRQSTADEDDLQQHQDMTTLQTQVPSSSNGASMTNNITVYDPSRNHLGSSTHTG